MPGSGKQPPEIQHQIKELLEAGFDPTTIHRRLKVGRSSIYRMKRCLQQHGTNYMPPELNKKNGRPKVLTPDQELEVREWLRDPKNRTRYLDDLVWLIHDRFGIVCSTTTMSKMKRKWLRVIEFEETGQPIDDLTRSQLMETHPDLPVLHESAAAATETDLPNVTAGADDAVNVDVSHMPSHQQQQGEKYDDTSFTDVTGSYAEDALYPTAPLQPDMAAHMQSTMPQQFQDLQASMGAQMPPSYVSGQQQLEPQIDSQLEHQLNHQISTSADLGNYGQPTTQ